MALPLVISSGSASLMYVIDRVFLTWYSTDAVAAALPASMLHWTLVSLPTGTVSYVNTFVAAVSGGGRTAADRRRPVAGDLPVAHRGSHFARLRSAGPAHLRCVWPRAGRSPPGNRIFWRARATEPFRCWCRATLACFYSGRGKTKVIMWINLAARCAERVLDYLLIFGVGGLPRMGIAGAATATVIAWTAGAVMYAVALLRHPERSTMRLGAGLAFPRRSCSGACCGSGCPTAFNSSSTSPVGRCSSN